MTQREKERFFFRLRNELAHVKIMKQRVDREKRMGFDQCMYRGHQASGDYSLSIAQNTVELLKRYNDEDITKICVELSRQLSYGYSHVVDRLINQLRVVILGR